MKTIRVLVLEDDLETLSVIMTVLKDLEDKLIESDNKRDIAVTVFSEYTQVEDFVNKLDNPNYDLVLLDRDCKLGGSFHALDVDKIGINRIVGISSVPEYNRNLISRGVSLVVDKDYSKMDLFRRNLSNTLFINYSI